MLFWNCFSRCLLNLQENSRVMSAEAPDNTFWCSLIVPGFLSSFLLSYTVYLNVAVGQDFTVIKHWTATGRSLSSLLLCMVAEDCTYNPKFISISLWKYCGLNWRFLYSFSPNTVNLTLLALIKTQQQEKKKNLKDIPNSSLTSQGKKIFFRALAGENMSRI